MATETEHAKGYDGVIMAKKWLESTTRFRIHFSVYESEAMCTMPLLGGGTKVFDMQGVHVEHDATTNRCPLYVEVKNYDTRGGQGTKYQQHLRDCYLAAARELVDGVDRKTEFMWLTWHPFALKKWSKLCSEDELRRALADSDLGSLNEALVRSLPQRLWLVVLSRRQDELTMGDQLLGEIRRIVTQKAIS